MHSTYDREFHVALLSPVCTPGVANDPVPLLDIHANDLHCVIGASGGTVGEYTFREGAEARGIYGHDKSATVENVVDHVLLSFQSLVLEHGDREVGLRCVAVSGCNVVGVGGVIRDATFRRDSVEGFLIVATVTIWRRISAE